MTNQIRLRMLVLFLFISTNLLSQNQLKNPGYEKVGESWSFWGGVIQSEVYRSGNSALKVSLNSPSWSGADQIIFLPEGVNKIEVSGWIKTDNIKAGTQPWEKARIAIEFLNTSGTKVGEYPPVVGQISGTNDWQQFSHTYFIPQGVQQLKVQTVLGNCTGTAYYDDIEVLLFGQDEKNIEAVSKSGPMDEGKWYEIEVNEKYDGSHYVDWSGLLDAPAGKHGFSKAVNGHIQFEDGTPAKFWGTNLVASSCFVSKEKADSLALRLSKMGCNLIRLHHMDAPWSKPNIFGNAENTRTLSPESMDKLDYLIAALKKKGIYIFLDLLVHRDFMVTDGITNRPPDLGGKQVGYFDKKIIELQKEYITQLLNHKNAYTGFLYKEEPAILASEFINESSAFLHFGGDILTDSYKAELQAQFEAAGNTGKKLASFDLDYNKGTSPVVKEKTGSNGDVEASLKFLSKVETDYYTEMKNLMRSMGVKYLLSGSNFPNPVLAYQKDNTIMDLIITNDYWDHPQLWKMNNDWNKILYAPINNTSQIRNPAVSTNNAMNKYIWYKKPFIVTEYNACYPNEYILEAMPMVAAYSKLQDVDGLLQFDFGSTPFSLGADRISPFSLSKMPDHLAQWVAAAPIFLRGDVQPAKGLVLDKITDEQAYSLPTYSDFLDKNFYLSYVTKVAKTYGNETADEVSKYTPYYDKANEIIKSETGELKLDSKKGVFEMNTPKVQGVTGNLNDTEFNLPAIKIKVKNSWASVIAVSKDNKPLTESTHFYLVVVSPVKMKDQKYSESRGALVEPGKLPLMAQVVEGDIIIKTKNKKATITSISPTGQKGKILPNIYKNDGIGFKLADGRTFVYEIVLH